MNEAILKHLGIALLGDLHMPSLVPVYMMKTYTAYENDQRLYLSLVGNEPLKEYLLTQELPIPDTFVGRATLATLGVIFGQFKPDQAHIYMNEMMSQNLFDRLKRVIRVRRVEVAAN